MAERCDHSEFEDTQLYGGQSGLPTMHCLKCDSYFDDGDLVHNARLDAAEMAGPKDEGWAKRYIDALTGLGYAVIPWPAHLDPPHASTEAHPHLKRPDISIELYIVNGDILAAMKSALDWAFVYPT